MNVLVCCGAGMSSSLLVQKMRDETKKRALMEVKIGSCSQDQIRLYLDEADVILIAPQLAFFEKEITKKAENYDIKIYTLNYDEYGSFDVESIFNKILYQEKSNQDEENASVNNYIKSLDYITKNVYPFANAIAKNKVLSSLNKAFISVMPVTILGSIFTLLNNLPIVSWNNFLDQLGISNLFELISNTTTEVISLYIVFFMSFHLVKSFKLQGQIGGLLSLVCFFLVTGRVGNSYETTYLGSKGLFSAIFISTITSYLYKFILSKIDRVKFPSKVANKIADSLLAVIPFLVTITLFLALAYVMSLSKYHSLNAMIYTELQVGLSYYLGNNLFSYVFFLMIAALLWFFGIHGGNITGSITRPVYTYLALENFNAYKDGSELPNIIHNQLGKCFTQGGIGSMLSLSVIMIIFSKSEKFKAIGKISLPTCIFYINEPILFSAPVVLNPLFFIPLMIVQPILAILTYFIMKIGLIPYANGAQVPWTTPPIIYGLLQGSIKLALWEIVCFLIACFIWYPFFKIADNLACLEEKKE